MLRKIIILCLLLAILSPLVLLTQLIDSHPLVLQPRTPDSADAQKTKELLKRSWNVLKQDRRTELTLKVDDLNAAVAFVGRGMASLSGQFILQQQRLTGQLSLKIPQTPLGQYINFSVDISPSETGLDIESCSIGTLRIPGFLALLLAEKSVDLLSDEQLGRQIIATIEKVSFVKDRIFVTFSSGSRFGLLKNRILARLKQIETNQDTDLELEKIHYYLQQIEALNSLPVGKPVSLSQILVPLFQEAHRRSSTTAPVAENRAALYAVAIALGGEEFRKLSNYLLNPKNRFHTDRKFHFLLAERHDLLQHFMVSAGIKLMSDLEIGFAVGEFKELLDANKGGSGFSFIDLAADRTGLQFAETATSSPESAKRFQEIITTITTEKEFFPKFTDLEEGLNRNNFMDRYGNIDSRRYQEIVALIDQRLAELPLYQ